MKHLLISFLALTFLLFSCSPPSNKDTHKPSTEETDSESARLNEWFDQKYDEYIDRNPVSQSYKGIKKDYGKWNDRSQENLQKEQDILKANLAEFKERFVFDKLDEQAKLSYRLWEYDTKRNIEGFTYRYNDYPFNQMFGTHTFIPSFLINVHRVDSLSDAEAYISRLNGVQTVMDEALEGVRIRTENGVVPPKFVFVGVLDAMQHIIKGKPFDKSEEASTLLKDFTEKVNGLEDIADSTKADLLARGEQALLESVKPAYEKAIDMMTRVEKNATTDDGVWKLPDGDVFYQYRLSLMTTTNMTPQQIFDTGMSEIKRIHGEMEGIMKKVGFEGDLKAFFDFMEKDKQFYEDNTAEGRANYLRKTNEAIDLMRTKLDELFLTKPKAELTVKPVEAFREKTAGKAFYNDPAPDGSRPGTYYVNLYKMEDMPTYQMEALAFHEAIPGHHMQLAIAQELKGLPKFRTYESEYTAYVEGWGLYSEYVPKEIGFYTDPYSDFGRLAMELWRSCRLVVDVGIHDKKWTREKGIKFYAENTPNPYGDCVKMVERHIIMAGQATAYKVGQLKILELREEAKAALGDKFDIRAFHDVVLTNGAVPLDILEELVKEWTSRVMKG